MTNYQNYRYANSTSTLYRALKFGSAAVCFICFLFSCADNGNSTDTYSSSFSGKKEKMDFLARHFQLKTKVKDAEYHIMVQDNSGGLVPGPSFWSYHIALKLDPADLDRWIDTNKKVEPYELPDWSQILPATYYWNTDGEKRFFEGGYVWVEETSILLYVHSVN